MSGDWCIAVEGDSDAAVAAAILRSTGRSVRAAYVCDGKANLDARLREFAAAALHSPWLVLRDLDHDATCPAELLVALRPGGAAGVVRVAVRAIESWLLADAVAAARWLGVPAGRITHDVEAIADPKAELIALARRSRNPRVREDMVPRTKATIGPGYVDQVRTYCAGAWRPDHAARRSPSLARCLRFVARGPR